jgi:hypothetical protein
MDQASEVDAAAAGAAAAGALLVLLPRPLLLAPWGAAASSSLSSSTTTSCCLLLTAFLLPAAIGAALVGLLTVCRAGPGDPERLLVRVAPGIASSQSSSSTHTTSAFEAAAVLADLLLKADMGGLQVQLLAKKSTACLTGQHERCLRESAGRGEDLQRDVCYCWSTPES